MAEVVQRDPARLRRRRTAVRSFDARDSSVAMPPLSVFVCAPEGLLDRRLSVPAAEPVWIGWLHEEATVTRALIATFVQQTSGSMMVLFLLGLAASPRDPLKVARIGDARTGRVFQNNTLQLRPPTQDRAPPLLLFASLTIFDQAWIILLTYPQKIGSLISVFLYCEALQKSGPASGTALAVLTDTVALGAISAQTVPQDLVERRLRCWRLTSPLSHSASGRRGCSATNGGSIS